MGKKLQWYKLKDLKCPSCSSGLEFFDNSSVYKCVNCDFMITDSRYAVLIKKMKEAEMNRFK